MSESENKNDKTPNTANENDTSGARPGRPDTRPSPRPGRPDTRPTPRPGRPDTRP